MAAAGQTLEISDQLSLIIRPEVSYSGFSGIFLKLKDKPEEEMFKIAMLSKENIKKLQDAIDSSVVTLCKILISYGDTGSDMVDYIVDHPSVVLDASQIDDIKRHQVKVKPSAGFECGYIDDMFSARCVCTRHGLAGPAASASIDLVSRHARGAAAEGGVVSPFGIFGIVLRRAAAARQFAADGCESKI